MLEVQQGVLCVPSKGYQPEAADIMFPCPQCDSDVTITEHPDKNKNGRYVCNNCGKKGEWVVRKGTKLEEIMEKMRGRRKKV